jgi:hypothetical protein
MTPAGVRLTYCCARRFAALLGLAWLLGCEHSEPFGSRGFDSDQPFNSSPPIRLTLNRGPDRRAAWLPDGSGFLYSTQLPGRSDNDVCLGQLPPGGGRQRTLTCDLSPTGADLTEALESAAPFDDGRLAFVAATSRIGARVPDSQTLVVGSVSDPATRLPLVSVPYTLPGRHMHSGISQLHWLGATRLVYLGEAVNVFTPCILCQMDTLRSGLDVVWVSLDNGTATLHLVPGSDNASGISPGAAPDEVYYTLAADSRVYRQELSSGAVSQVHDFGPGSIARDVHVVGSRLTATVGGRVHFTDHPAFGLTQWDSGGFVHVVDLDNGTDIVLESPPQPSLFRRPRLSPSGSAVLVEAYPLIISPGAVDGSADTTVSPIGDLFLFGQP